MIRIWKMASHQTHRWAAATRRPCQVKQAAGRRRRCRKTHLEATPATTTIAATTTTCPRAQPVQAARLCQTRTTHSDSLLLRLVVRPIEVRWRAITSAKATRHSQTWRINQTVTMAMTNRIRRCAFAASRPSCSRWGRKGPIKADSSTAAVMIESASSSPGMTRMPPRTTTKTTMVVVVVVLVVAVAAEEAEEETVEDMIEAVEEEGEEEVEELVLVWEVAVVAATLGTVVVVAVE